MTTRYRRHNDRKPRSGIGLLTVIGIVLVVLKLAELITISWWLVLLPFYIVPLAVFVIIVLATIIAS